jgi:hypothetical protein
MASATAVSAVSAAGSVSTSLSQSSEPSPASELTTWTPTQRSLILHKLGQFYERYVYARFIHALRPADLAKDDRVLALVREKAQCASKRRMYTLECIDVRTCGEILGLLSELLTTRDRVGIRNQLQRVFRLMHVLDEKDPRSWTFDDLYNLWCQVMARKAGSPPPFWVRPAPPMLQKHHVPNPTSVPDTPSPDLPVTPRDRDTLPRRRQIIDLTKDDDHLLDFYMEDDNVYEEDNRAFELFLKREINKRTT